MSQFFNPFGGTASGGGSSVPGPPGKDGKGIVSITFINSTAGSTPGITGATDTYRITYTDGTNTEYVVKNGEKGDTGIAGPRGEIGPQGPQGPRGNIGLQGPSGEKGADGKGIISIDFLSSTDGEQAGIEGATDTYKITYTDNTTSNFIVKNGTKGSTGLTGETGPKGETGETGAAGKDGISVTNATIDNLGHLIITLSNSQTLDAGMAKGSDGTSINILGDLVSTSELPSSGQKLGDCYLISGNLWVYTNSTEEGSVNGFKNAGTIKGPSGRGIVSTSINELGQLIITYSDNTEDNVGKVVGETGATGLQGPQGEQGDTGLTGLSAYEIFKKNNPESTLTEAEWLLSLTGTTGKDGNGIKKIDFTSSTGGDISGIAGATDTYTITFTNGMTSTFTVYNGKDGVSREITIDTEMSDTSTNTVQNKTIKAYVDGLVGNIKTILETLTTVS